MGTRPEARRPVMAVLDERQVTTTMDEQGRVDCVRTWPAPTSPTTGQENNELYNNNNNNNREYNE